MSEYSLSNQKVVVLGLGKTGLSCVQFCLQQGAQVEAMDSRTPFDIGDLAERIAVHWGEFSVEPMTQADLVLISPGIDPDIPVVRLAKQLGVEIIGDIELFARFNNLPVVAVTGSNGKSTVVALLGTMLEQGGYKVRVGGNYGVPALDLLQQDAEILVLELSSFQLEMQQSLAPKIASVLNLSEDHIDRHKTLSNYQRIKLSIYNRAQYRVVNFDDALTHPEHGYHMSFSQDNNPEGFGWDALTNTIIYAGKPVLNLNNTSLIGSHNALNLQAAAAMALQLGVGFADMQLAAERFIPLAHRCQLVAEINNTRWINDSKATNVGATLAAIKGLTNHFLGRLFLIVGGDSKGADLSPLSTILKSVNTYLLTLGQDALHFMRLGVACEQVVDLEQAVTRAASLAKSGDIVLLSPACASQDMFDNFEHRGEVFMKAVQEQQ